MSSTIDTAQLQTLKLKEIKARITELTGQTPKSNNRPYLLRKLTAALEAKAAEEAKARKARAKKAKTARKAKAAKAEAAQGSGKRGRRAGGERDPRLPEPGTVLERDYQGKTIKVTVLEDGFRYQGETYRSLSTVAREATGTIWNGFLFFHLTSYPQRKQADAA
jgi:hypothetical protein